MYKVPHQMPKAQHFDRVYPLTKFLAFLLDQGLRLNTAKVYTSNIRRMLGVMGEGRTLPDGTVQRRVWENVEAVREYRSALKARLRNQLQCAWTYWLNYTGSEAALAISDRAMKGIVTGAVRVFIYYAGDGKGVPYLRISDIPRYLWEFDDQEQTWYLTRMMGSRDRYLLGPGVRVLGDIIREWGYPDGDAHGQAFLADAPRSLSPMSIERVRSLLDNKLTPATEKWLNEKMKADYEAAIAPVRERDRAYVPPEMVGVTKLRMKTNAQMQEGEDRVIGYDEAKGEIRLVNGKIVVEHPEDLGFYNDGGEDGDEKE